MTIQEKLRLKANLFDLAVDIIRKRIANAAAAMQNAQSAANEEEKSSAGDKYETSRAMGHIEKDMYAKQTEENNKELASLLSIDYKTIHSAAAPGSYLEFDESFFFIAAGIGKIEFEGKTGYILSANAPLAKLLHNKKIGDVVLFNNQQRTIISLF